MYVCMDGWMTGGIYVCIHFTKYLSRNNNVLGLELDSYEEQETHAVPLSLRCGHVNHNRQQL